jgi:glycosyltransferase involved in cell wall biosynthesis
LSIGRKWQQLQRSTNICRNDIAKQTMKILHINTERTWRGGEQQTLNLLAGLNDCRIASHLVCQAGSPMEERAVRAGVEVFPLTMRGEIDLVAGLRIRKLINKFKYDIIHSHTSHAHSLAFLASIGAGVHRLVTRRVDFSIFRHSFLHLSGLKYRFMADYYIAISHRIKEVLVNDGIPEQRIFVVHSGIDPQRFEQARGDHLMNEFKIKDNQKVVINVAHLAGHKGQKFLVRAVPHVLKQIPGVRFFIIGKGELMAELQALSASLGINQALTFTGFRKDVGAFYNIADLFVMSSIQEGLGTVVLDALALGKPVVAANSGGIPEIINDGKTGRLVEPADSQALAKGIVEMLTHTEQARRMAECGQTVVKEKFSIEAMVEKNLAIYDQLLSTAGGSCGSFSG